MLLAVGLGIGGTETHVLELASGIDRSKFDVTVCSLKSGGCLVEELRRRGIRVVCLNGAGKGDPRVLFRLWKLMQAERPDVIQSFLFWANLAARLLGRLSNAVRVVCSYHDEIVSEGWLVRMIDRFTFQWSHAVVCCSEAVRRSVSNCLGAPAPRQTIITFGVDAGQFAVGDAASTRENSGAMCAANAASVNAPGPSAAAAASIAAERGAGGGDRPARPTRPPFIARR